MSDMFRTHTDRAEFTLTPEEWMRDASCAQVDPELFFAEKADRGLREQAKRVCRSCPVLDECAAYVKTHPQRHGIWAGKSRDNRSR